MKGNKLEVINPDKSNSELSEVFESLLKKANSEDPKFDPRKHKDETRAQIAILFTKWFFRFLGIILVGAPIYNMFVPTELVISIKDTILVFSGVIGGPFGFVMGYYFKGSENS